LVTEHASGPVLKRCCPIRPLVDGLCFQSNSIQSKSSPHRSFHAAVLLVSLLSFFPRSLPSRPPTPPPLSGQWNGSGWFPVPEQTRRPRLQPHDCTIGRMLQIRQKPIAPSPTLAISQSVSHTAQLLLLARQTAAAWPHSGWVGGWVVGASSGKSAADTSVAAAKLLRGPGHQDPTLVCLAGSQGSQAGSLSAGRAVLLSTSRLGQW